MWEIYIECEKRIRTVLLATILAGILYWLSFFLFLQNPQRSLIPAARSFVEAVDLLEEDQTYWASQYLADIDQVLELARQHLDTGINTTKTSVKRSLNLDTQLQIQDNLLLDFINRSGAENYIELVENWIEEIDWLKSRKIVHKSEVLDLWLPYLALNQESDWLIRVGQAVGMEDDELEIIPSKLLKPKWKELHDQEFGLLFSSFEVFESKVYDLQTLYQGEITDQMQEKALRGTGIWLRNLDSGRQIANQIASREPNISLPLLGEHLTGRWAFYLAPLFFLLAFRYLRLLTTRADHLWNALVESRTTPEEGSHDRIVEVPARFPHLLSVLSGKATNGDQHKTLISVTNYALLLGVVFFPLTTSLPVGIVDFTITMFPASLALVPVLSLYAIAFVDGFSILRSHTVR